MDFSKVVPQRVRTWLPTRHRGIAHLVGQVKDVVPLSNGDVAFTSPDHVLAAAREAIAAGQTHYTDPRALREAIADKLWRDNQIKADPDTEIIVSDGCHAVLFQLFQALVEPGDEVIMGTPGSYYHGNTLYQGGTPVEIPLREERRFRMDPDEIAAAITPRTKIIALTTPDGPVGAVHLQADLEKVAELAQRHDLLVISDEIYEKINYGTTPHFSIASLPGMAEHTITVNGFSKGYAMTGWRVGYAVVPAPLMPAVKAINALNTIWINSIAHAAAVAAYRGPQDPIQQMVEVYRERMTWLIDSLNAIDVLQAIFPDATYYAWPNIKAFGLTSEQFATHVLLSEGVLVLPGTSFGSGGEGYIRVSCSAPEATTREALRRLERSIARLKTEGPLLELQTPVMA